MDKLNIASWKVRGLQNNVKRRAIFNQLRLLNVHIACLQETHSTPNNETVWTSEWGGKIVFNHDTSRSAGVAVLISKDCKNNVKIENMLTDTVGRTIALNLTCFEYSYTLCNIYAPNVDNPAFFTTAFEFIQQLENAEVMFMGDFNFAVNPVLDRGEPTGRNNNLARDKFLELASAIGLSDQWRIRNPDKKEFSWFRNTNTPGSRLDYLYMNEGLINRNTILCYCSSVLSDHQLLKGEFRFQSNRRGPGFWKFNNTLLSDAIFTRQFRSNFHPMDRMVCYC